jgi:hypothetical protein
MAARKTKPRRFGLPQGAAQGPFRGLPAYRTALDKRCQARLICPCRVSGSNGCSARSDSARMSLSVMATSRRRSSFTAGMRQSPPHSGSRSAILRLPFATPFLRNSRLGIVASVEKGPGQRIWNRQPRDRFDDLLEIAAYIDPAPAGLDCIDQHRVGSAQSPTIATRLRRSAASAFDHAAFLPRPSLARLAPTGPEA